MATRAMTFANYMQAQAESRAAYQEYNAASRGLELAKIKERCAELESQHEPLASLIQKNLDTRDMIMEAVKYVIFNKEIK